MLKKVFSILLSLLILGVCLCSCGEEKGDDSSSSPVGETQTSSVETSSTSTSSKKGGVDRGDGETASQGVKVYKNPGKVMMGCYMFCPQWCTSLGTDSASVMTEYEDVVKEGYFNTYFLYTNSYLLQCAKIVAENGGTIWLMPGNFNSQRRTIEEYKEDMKYYLDLLTKAGLRDITLGVIYDEPIWNDQTNADFLAQCKANYELGLRNFPVFALGEFSDHEGNLDVSPDDMNKLDPKYATYITDVAYDSYGADVRDNGKKMSAATIAELQKKISPNIVDGKTYYTEYKKYLQKYIGHDANFWYYPACFQTASIDEGHCLGHLEFMSEDVLKEEYVGGIILYSYKTNDDFAFGGFMDLKTSSGAYKYYPEIEDK